MRSLQILVTLAFYAVTATACGNDDKKKTQSPPPENSGDQGNDINEDPSGEKTAEDVTPVLVFMGGYTSCMDANNGPDNMNLSDMFTRAQEEMATKTGKDDGAYFLSCYGLDPNTATYLTSKTNAKKQTRSVANMEKDLATFVSSLKNSVLYIAGHSYGAYTALKLVQALGPEIKVRALITLDAISKVGCTPESALAAFLNNAPTPQGCRESPGDLNAADLQAIKARVGTWINYYQTDSPILHSGPMTLAQNEKRSYESSGFGPHNDIVFDEAVIEEVAAAIIKAASP